MKWDSPERLAFIARMNGKISDELRTVMMGMGHIDVNIAHLQAIGYYVSAVLTAILVVLLLR